MRVRAPLAAVVAGAVVTVTGCGKGAAEAPRGSGGGGATRAPSAGQRPASLPITRAGSAGAVVTQFIADVRDGAGPAAFPAYDPRIAARVGLGNVLGALQVMTDLTQGTEPVVARRRRTSPSGELVIVRLRRPDGTGTRYSFVLRRKGHRWRIVYDSLLAQALQSYVVSRRASDPAKPPRAATQAAARAVSALRLAALQPAPRRRPARAEQAPAQPGQTTVPTAPVVPGTATTPPATGTGTTTTGR